MRVVLLSQWFGPDGVLYPKGLNEDIPDDLVDVLPSTAKDEDGNLIRDGKKPEPKAPIKAPEAKA